jgi:hypothetical protein
MTGDCLRHNAADAILAKRGPSEKAGAAEDRLLPAVLDFFDSHEA